MKALVIKIGALGDVIMSLPLLHQLKKQGYSVTWVVGQSAAPLLRHFGVDHCIEVDCKAVLHGRTHQKLRELRSVWQELAWESFDQVLVAHADWRYLAFCPFKKNRVRFNPIPGRYHGYEYLRLIDQSHLVWPEISVPLPKCMERLKSFVVLAPGGNPKTERGKQLRMWPIANYVSLAQKFIACGKRVVISGGRGDLWVSSHFSHLQVVDLVGKLDVIESLALFQASERVITHDSGPMHLAVLAGTRVTALFGPTLPLEKLPVSDQITPIWGGTGLACSPCHVGKSYAKCSHVRCMQNISVQQVHEVSSHS